MRAIFISYRRGDSEGQAGRLFTDLKTHFGEANIFMDVAGIEPGRDFRRVIDEHVASCGVLLAIIGKNWVDARDEAGRRRLDDARDFVRLETASALKRDIPVIPVLVQGAQMPQSEQLPPDLAEFAYRNGVELTHARWDSDVQILIRALGAHVEPQQHDAALASSPSPARKSSAAPDATVINRSAAHEPAEAPSAPAGKGKPPLAVAFTGAAILLVLMVGGFAWFGNSAESAAAPDRVETPSEPQPASTPPPSERTAAPDQVGAPAKPKPTPAPPIARGAGGGSNPDAEASEAKRRAEGRAEREARETAEAKAAAEHRARWATYVFPPPNAGLLVYTIMPDGHPACASYDGGGCLWQVPYDEIDFTKLKPLVCGEGHRALYGVTGYEDPMHWCSLARTVRGNRS